MTPQQKAVLREFAEHAGAKLMESIMECKANEVAAAVLTRRADSQAIVAEDNFDKGQIYAIREIYHLLESFRADDPDEEEDE